MENVRKQEIACLFLKTRFKRGSFPTEKFIEEKAKQIGISSIILKYFFESLLEGAVWITPEKQREISLLFVKEIFSKSAISFDGQIQEISNSTGVPPEEISDFLHGLKPKV